MDIRLLETIAQAHLRAGEMLNAIAYQRRALSLLPAGPSLDRARLEGGLVSMAMTLAMASPEGQESTATPYRQALSRIVEFYDASGEHETAAKWRARHRQ